MNKKQIAVKIRSYGLLILSVILQLALSQRTYSQVTIGSQILPPNSGALLDLKEKSSTGLDQTTTTKGLNLPRVALVDIDKLYPMLPNGYSASENSLHTGLMVYNTVSGTIQSSASGGNVTVTPCIYIWDGAKWNSLCTDGCVIEFNPQYALADAVLNLATQEITASNPCCSQSGTYQYSVEPAFTSYATVTPNSNATGKFIVTFNTENTSSDLRGAVIKVLDPCGYVSYFTAIQKGADPLTNGCGIIFNPKYTDADATGSLSTDEITASNPCCNQNGTYQYSVEPASLATVTSNNTTGKFTVTFNTENTSSDPREVVIKVIDPCGYVSYFTAVQKGAASSGSGGGNGNVGELYIGFGVSFESELINSPAYDTVVSKQFITAGKYRVYFNVYTTDEVNTPLPPVTFFPTIECRYAGTGTDFTINSAAYGSEKGWAGSAIFNKPPNMACAIAAHITKLYQTAVYAHTIYPFKARLSRSGCFDVTFESPKLNAPVPASSFNFSGSNTSTLRYFVTAIVPIN